MRSAADMTVEEFRAYLKQQMHRVIHFDDRVENGTGNGKQKRTTRTQQGYIRASMRRTRGNKWGYTGERN
tara:strand:- start:3363 stop:3572 length:210 start_codon:yes stop_codon:yes gene_type:complete